MKICTWTVALLASGLLMAGAAHAQQPAAPATNPSDVVPEKMPFNTPYGTPISLEKAQAAIHAAVAEANKRGWPLNVAVVDSGGSLVSFARMDGAQLASIAIARAQGACGGKIPPADEGLRRSDTKRLRLHHDARRHHRFARRHPLGRGRQAHRRDRLLRRHRLSRRGGVHGGRGHDQ